VQPFGWVIASHVRDGKQALDLSTFGSLGKKSQAQRLEYMAEAIVDREMPLWVYRQLHLHTNPSEQQVAVVNEWFNQTLTVFESHLRATEVASR
jgi:hypothetical protein